MDHPAEITFHDMPHSEKAEEQVLHRIDRLETLAGRLVSCRVSVNAPHQRHRKGNHYEVRVEARSPSAVFMVDREPGDVNAHEDLNVAIRDAFDAIERQAKKWKETHTGRPTAHAEPLHGRVAELRPDEDSGQIALTDGRLVYFHRNAVGGEGYDSLREGAAVEIALDPGEDSELGPHASFVRPVSEQRLGEPPSR